MIWVFFSKESNRTFRLQNNTVYELQSIQFGTTFKQEHAGKVSTHNSCVLPEL